MERGEGEEQTNTPTGETSGLRNKDAEKAREGVGYPGSPILAANLCSRDGIRAVYQQVLDPVPCTVLDARGECCTNILL